MKKLILSCLLITATMFVSCSKEEQIKEEQTEQAAEKEIISESDSLKIAEAIRLLKEDMINEGYDAKMRFIMSHTDYSLSSGMAEVWANGCVINVYWHTEKGKKVFQGVLMGCPLSKNNLTGKEGDIEVTPNDPEYNEIIESVRGAIENGTPYECETCRCKITGQSTHWYQGQLSGIYHVVCTGGTHYIAYVYHNEVTQIQVENGQVGEYFHTK